jgi:beta-lactamase class A
VRHTAGKEPQRQRPALALLLLLLLACDGATPAAAPPTLWDHHDPGLQRALEDALNSVNRDYLIAAEKGTWGFALVDVTDLRRPAVAWINPDQTFYAASVPKLGILLAAFVLIDEGELTLDDPTRDSLRRMIRNSSNVDAAKMYERIGAPRIAEILERFGLYHPERGGGIWVGKSYDKTPRWKGDPLHGLSHAATAMQGANFYYGMLTNRFVSPELSAEMKSILGEPQVNHKFVKGLEGRGARIYRKSGTWRTHHADTGVIEYDDRRYIVAALANSPRGEIGLRQLIVIVDDLMEAKHRP